MKKFCKKENNKFNLMNGLEFCFDTNVNNMSPGQCFNACLNGNKYTVPQTAQQCFNAFAKDSEGTTAVANCIAGDSWNKEQFSFVLRDADQMQTDSLEEKFSTNEAFKSAKAEIDKEKTDFKDKLIAQRKELIERLLYSLGSTNTESWVHGDRYEYIRKLREKEEETSITEEINDAFVNAERAKIKQELINDPKYTNLTGEERYFSSYDLKDLKPFIEKVLAGKLAKD